MPTVENGIELLREAYKIGNKELTRKIMEYLIILIQTKGTRK
jgi:hypothetical protein